MTGSTPEALSFSALERCFFTPVLWQADPPSESPWADEWNSLRSAFAAAREGRFHELDNLFEASLGFQDPVARQVAQTIIGAAGTDQQLERVEHYMLESVLGPVSPCDFCRTLVRWGRLSSVNTILTVYDRESPSQASEHLPGCLGILLERVSDVTMTYPIGARAPLSDAEIDAFTAYDERIRALLHKKSQELGGLDTYVQFGEVFSVRKTAERFLEFARGPYSASRHPYLREKFEACTGIDCSDFFGEPLEPFQHLTAAARLEEWLHSDQPDRYQPGERYFFGHHIPRQSGP